MLPTHIVEHVTREDEIIADDTPTAVVERIAEISTRFWLASACDRQLLQVAAAKVVAQNQPEILTFLEGDATRGAAR
jgi:hypothetical protein